LRQLPKVALTVKSTKNHIIHSWILLICLIAGQYMVYVHQHRLIKPGSGYAVSPYHLKQIVSEKCQLCDAMHHTTMVIDSNAFFATVGITDCIYISPVYNFPGTALIRSGGRAPPATDYSVRIKA